MSIQRWWEAAALKVGLDLSAGLGTVPEWIFQDSEARRIGVGAGVRSASVGGAFTGRVLLEGVSSLLPASQGEIESLFGRGMEGPLWLDIGKDGTWLEGAIFTPRGGAQAWLEDVKAVGVGAFGELDQQGRLVRCEEALPSARVGGMRMSLAPSLELELILQQALGGGADQGEILEGLATIGALCALGEGDINTLKESCSALMGPASTLMDVILPATGSGLILRFWNVSKAGARGFLKDAGAQAEALSRFDALLKHAQCADIPRLCLRFKPGRAPGVRFLVDLGLAEY